MPKIWPILSQGFPQLFAALGIQAIPSGPQWWLSDTIVPVSLIDTQVALRTRVTGVIYDRTEIFDGSGVAPAVLTVIADTGNVVAGSYDIQIYTSAFSGTAGARMDVQHRNAADTANIWTHLLLIAGGTSNGLIANMKFAVTLLEDERVKVIVNAAFGAGDVVSATIMAKRQL